jgi:Carboxypeptidase regulatory-like domain
LRALKLGLLVTYGLGLALLGQDPSPVPPAISPPPTTAPPEAQAPGVIQGTVLSGATGQTLRRAQVVLKPTDAKASAIYQTTDQSGSFSFLKVPTGRYMITVQRDGYLPLSAGHIGSYKMPPIFSVQSGQTISSFVFTLTPSGVVSGKVKFDDAEPAVNVAVQLYRSYYDRGRHGYAAAASGRTDDRGEYRLHGLEPGSYYVAALYQTPPRPSGAEEQEHTDAQGNPLPDLSYAVTFFPQAQKMSEAVPVKIGSGAEVGGIDIFLTLVHTVHVRGRVVGTGVISSPNVALRWNDPDNTASVSAPINVSINPDQGFDIQGVTAGPYLLVASGVEGGVTLTGRTPLNVGDADVADVSVVVDAESMWSGKIRVDGGDPPQPQGQPSGLPPGLAISLQPRRPLTSATRAQVSEDGEFTIPFAADETYDLYVANAPGNFYLKSVRVANAERLGEGLEASSGEAPPTLEVVLGAHGGQVLGRAVTTDPKVVASGATIALIPDPPAGHVQAYQLTNADEYGNFTVQGLAPGKYLLVGWLDQPACDIYNPDDFAACQAQGYSFSIGEGEQQSAQVTAN